MGTNQTEIYLMSSNASKEYILDIMETLAIPFGTAHHFRYQLRWLDDDLKANLPEKGTGLKEKLKNTRIVICYLYQVKNENGMIWEAIYPVRTATLIDAYKTGNKDEDIAHFYFKVDNYIRYDCEFNYTEIIKELAEENWGNKYSFLGKFIGTEYVASANESRSAFHTICESFNQAHFKSSEPNGKKYYPLFCFIDGLTEKGKFMKIKYDKFSNRSYYSLKEGETYYFEFMTYLPRSQKISNSVIKLITDSDYFSSPSEYNLSISSRYNAESFTLISSVLEKTVWSIISFKFEINHSEDEMSALNLPIYFHIKIKRKLLYRIIDALSDIGFGVGTGSLAFKAALTSWDWWYITTIIGYSFWAIGRLIIKLWKG